MLQRACRDTAQQAINRGKKQLTVKTVELTIKHTRGWEQVSITEGRQSTFPSSTPPSDVQLVA